MNIDNRKEIILKAIIEEYIDSAEPVSSAVLISKYPIKFSSATIRNEMAELEKLGLIQKPYSSSGRIPSELGYRYYVDKLVEEAELSKEEVSLIKDMLEERSTTLEELLNVASTTLSELTHYTSIAVGPDIAGDKIKDVEFLLLGDTNLMVIILTDCGIIKEAIIKFEESINDDIVNDLKHIFKRKLVGKPLSTIDGKVEDYIIEELKISAQIIKKIIIELNRILNDSERVFLKGASKIFKLPEFKDEKVLDNLLNVIDEKENLREAFITEQDESGITIYIGEENELAELKDFSLITMSRTVNDKNFGTIGIIGPTRMDYAKVMAIMKQMAQALNKEDNKGIKEKKNKKDNKDKKTKNTKKDN